MRKIAQYEKLPKAGKAFESLTFICTNGMIFTAEQLKEMCFADKRMPPQAAYFP